MKLLVMVLQKGYYLPVELSNWRRGETAWVPEVNQFCHIIVCCDLLRFEKIAYNSYASWVKNVKANCLMYVTYATSEIQKAIQRHSNACEGDL